MADIAFAAVNIISGVFGSLGLAAFATSFVPKPPLAVTQVTIAIGQTADDPNKDDPDALGGNVPAIKVFALDGRTVGFAGGHAHHTWAAGSTQPVPIKNYDEVKNVQSEYIAVYMDFATNAICISAIGMKNPNDDTSFGWMGDSGAACGMQWHWSETIVGNTANTASYRSSCVWISGIGSKNDVTAQGLSMHILDFSKMTNATRVAYEADHRLMCDSTPRFSAWTEIMSDISPPFFIPNLNYDVDGSDADPKAVFVPGIDKTDYKGVEVSANGQAFRPVRMPFPPPAPKKVKRDGKIVYRRSEVFKSTLISSPYEEHSARQLCKSESSFGPDVVSEKEGLFCDMDEKKLWPLCSEKVKVACFDTNTNSMRGGSAKREPVPLKSYGTVKKWGSTGNA
ncbi:hypothetical protein BU16DRAFT_579673 [Lophium mytilinum]|uniref:Uncharacterized protein n=1 Tax=Lophium mytilinum TaxID=390894 RepID=A0A6A6R1J3_9PEZI|nr:hypothetical protein BU16DRAFT_579673 [Lophium mytilinum]